MNKSLIIIGKSLDFSLVAKNFAGMALDVSCCANHYDAIDFIREEIVESRSKDGLVVACCGTSVSIDSTIMNYVHQVPEHSIGVILCDPVEFHATLESLQRMEKRSAQRHLSDIGVFSLELIQKTFEQVEDLSKVLRVNDLILVEHKQQFFAPRNQKIPAKHKFANRNLGLQRKILRRWIGSNFGPIFFNKVPWNLTKKYFWLIYMYYWMFSF